MKLIDLFNGIANWSAAQVLRHSKIEDRAQEVKKFMKIAIELRRNNNFNGCQEILAGLNDSAIYRLRATWLKIEKDEKLVSEYEEIRRILSPDKSWQTYRHLLKEIQPPCIPYIGMYLTDLTFIEDGNPNYLPTTDNRSDIINFEKCRKQAVVIGNILLYQQDMYNFVRVDPIYDMFAKGLRGSEDKDALHKLSRQVEPPEMVEEAKRKAVKKADNQKNDPKKPLSTSQGSGRSSSSTIAGSPSGPAVLRSTGSSSHMTYSAPPNSNSTSRR
jgi:son of sevenless-like protein